MNLFLLLDCQLLCPLHLPVFGHRDFEKLLRRARRIGDGVGTGGDRGLDALVRAATGRDDWDIREVLSDTSDDIRRFSTSGNIDDGGSCVQAPCNIGSNHDRIIRSAQFMFLGAKN